MELINIDFNKAPKLLINGVEYEFNQKFNVKEHVFNNAGSTIMFKDVYPKNYTDDDIMNKPFRLERYSLCEVFFGNDLFYSGILKLQNKGSLKPTSLNKINITIASLKEFLVHEPMDFPIINASPESVVDRIIGKLAIPYVVKGVVSFTNRDKIIAYNTKNMSAYDTLRYVERHTNSTLFIKFNSSTRNISINFFDKDTIKSSSIGNIGIKIPFDTKQNALTFSDIYGIIDFDWKENANKDVNVVRMESEKTISTRAVSFEVDLSNVQETITSSFPVGLMNTKGIKYIDSTGTIIRNLIVATSKQVQSGKTYDISYTHNSNSIVINKRLFTNASGNKIIISYFPSIRQSIDFESKVDQNRVATNLKTSKGKLFRYEKMNDLTHMKDLIVQGKSLLDIGVSNKMELTIKSERAIWNVGDFVVFDGADIYKDFAGDYVVKDCKADFIVS